MVSSKMKNIRVNSEEAKHKNIFEKKKEKAVMHELAFDQQTLLRDWIDKQDVGQMDLLRRFLQQGVVSSKHKLSENKTSDDRPPIYTPIAKWRDPPSPLCYSSSTFHRQGGSQLRSRSRIADKRILETLKLILQFVYAPVFERQLLL